MALWGTSDSIFSPGTVTVNYATKQVTGSGTSFVGISTGSVISIGVGKTFGEAVVSGVTSQTVLSIASTQFLSGRAISGVGYTVSQKPVYTLHDSNYSVLGVGNTVNYIAGVDKYEAVAAVNTKYKVTHAGWVGVKTYMARSDADGSLVLRVKSETLVAFSGITTGTASYGVAGDAADDTRYSDYVIDIDTQPANRVGIATTANTTFAVVAASTPSTSLTYAWQTSPDNKTYTAVSNGVIYSNSTTATLGIAATTTTSTRPNGNYYRVLITASGTGGVTTTTSNPARLTYA
jgi:hypothetical protein